MMKVFKSLAYIGRVSFLVRSQGLCPSQDGGDEFVANLPCDVHVM